MPNLPFTLSLSLLSACTAAFALPSAPTQEDEVALLRARGPAGLDALLARWDRLAAGPERDALAAEIDQVAQQRYATTSRMYWYTDLATATAAAQQRHVPILELRLLGRLDEELSCANSRLFRATLYANTEVSKFLREHFVLYWSTERPVPKVTIEFGDGRTIHTTAVGNSAHFIRDEHGAIVDLLPGVYAPAPFRAELENTLAMLATLDATNADHRRAQLREYHARRAQETRSSWALFASRPFARQFAGLLEHVEPASAVALAQRLTISKAYIEVPQLGGIGADPGKLADDETAAWAKVGELAWPTSTPAPVLDKASRLLVLALHNAGPVKATTAELTALIPRFEQHLMADSALDQFKLRLQVHDYLATKPLEFAAIDRWLYAEVFKTPITDRWLGLLPRTDVTGLPGDGATAP